MPVSVPTHRRSLPPGLHREPPQEDFEGRKLAPHSFPRSPSHLRNHGSPEWRRRENGKHHARPLRRRIHFAHLHSRHPPKTRRSRPNHGQLHGAGGRRITAEWQSLLPSGHLGVWIKSESEVKNTLGGISLRESFDSGERRTDSLFCGKPQRVQGTIFLRIAFCCRGLTLRNLYRFRRFCLYERMLLALISCLLRYIIWLPERNYGYFYKSFSA